MIRLPVSIGEALDKLTILEIKCKRIHDPERRVFCKQEYDLLYTELKPYVDEHAFHYAQLCKVNEDIWITQEIAREKLDLQKCIEILNKNDMRFRIKDVINQAAKSYIREQKGYAKRRALVISHLGLGDQVGLIGAVRYIALSHDETVVVCKARYAANVAAFFADNPTIKLWPVPYEHGYIPGKGPTETTPGQCVEYSRSDWSNVYLSGFYTCPRSSMNDLPSNFYRDMGLDPEIRHTHFHIPTSQGAADLYSKIQNQPYIFVQQISSSHKTNLISWDRDEILTIDPNINVYSEGHKWYALAQEFVNKPFVHYTEVIKHAKEVHTVDSSFYCLAYHLPLDAQTKKCYDRPTGAVLEDHVFH
jgi:hypothetical protein